MTVAYKQARRDFEYLEAHKHLDDQVEIMAMVEELMRNPTKKFAAKMYEASISLWFHEHGKKYKNNYDIIMIANRYNLNWMTVPPPPKRWLTEERINER